MPLAFAVLCELVARAPALQAGAAHRLVFGVGQFVVGLNWIATAFTFQAAMPAWLGWVAVVLLSLYLAVYPALAAGLAWRFGAAPAAGARARARRRLGDHRMAARGDLHRLRLEPGRRRRWCRHAVARHRRADRHLRPVALVVLIGGALWLARQRELQAAGRDRRSLTLLLWAAAGRRASRPDRRVLKPIRIVQPNIGQQDKWRPGFAERPRDGSPSCRPRPGRDGRACCSGPKRRSPSRSRTRATGDHQALRRVRADPRRAPLSAPANSADRRHRA